MAISPKCATAIRAAAGSRPISAGKMQAISDGLDAKMRELARQDPQRWQGLSRDQRMSEAAAAAMADIAAEAKLKEFRAGLQALRAQETGERIAEQMGLGGKVTRSQAYIRDLVNTDDYAAGVRNEAISGLKDLLEAAGNRDGTGLLRNLGMRIFDLDNPQMTADVVREVFKNADGHTGNKAAKAAAKAWLDTIESMRLKFNGAGGDVGKLGYGYLSQAHDAFRVADAGADKWERFILDNNLLDRRQYVDVDGQLLGDAAVLDMLKAAHSTIAEHGANKTEPGSFKGSGSRANRGSDHRVLHFKDGDAWMAYMREYGEGSMYDAMMRHIGAMSRDIALTERMGPNPEATHRVQADIARRADAVHGKAGELIDGRSAGNTPEAYWNIVSGKTGNPESKFLARAGSDLRNIQTAAKITWGPFSALADVGTILQTLHYNKIPYFEYLKAYGRQFDAEHRATLRAHEVIAESLTHSINRWTGDNVGHSMTGHVTNGVMRLSLMNAWTDAARNAFADVMMTNATKQLGKPWASLTEWDRYLMQRKGITEADWSIITQAKPDPASRVPLLSPSAIRGVSDADVMASRPAEMAAISQRIADQTAELSARNAQDAAWINGRIDKFDDARDSLNRWVKKRLASRQKNNEKATGPMLERMALLDAQREQAKIQADMEADFNRFSTQDQVRAFLNAVEDGRSADLADVQSAKPAVRQGLESAEAVGRRYGVAKGRLERRMREIENRIAEMDRTADRAANADAKVAQKKADEMAADLRDFIKRSQERQARRQHVIDRLTASEAPGLAAEAARLRDQAATKWGAYVTDESQFAVVNPDIATRAIVTGGGMPAGTFNGEAWRSIAQFKSFPIAMLTRHWRRVMETPQGLEGAPLWFGAGSGKGAAVNRVALLAALGVTTTLLGAIQTQSRQILSGKDPIDMERPEFWGKSFAAGGGAGFLADLLMAPTDSPIGGWGGKLGAFGPVAGAGGGVIDIFTRKEKGATAARWVSDQLPFMDMWQTRALYERYLLHNAQEFLNPGYLSRMEQRTKQQLDQEWYWSPGPGLPERAPDMGAAFGR